MVTGWAPAAALVVIDMQRAFGPGTDWQTPGFEDLRDSLPALMDRFPGRTVLTRYLPPDPVTGSWVSYFQRYPTMLRDGNDPLWDLVIEPPDAASVVEAHQFNKWGPELRDAVDPGSALYLAGVATECCVLATALAAADAGRTVAVIGEACRGSTASLHEQTLHVLESFAPQISVVSSAEAIGQATGPG